jgi:prepilin peptidase CpaA
MNSFLIILLGCALIISIIEDVRRLKIPNLVTYPTMVLAMGYHSFSSGLSGLAFSTGGLAVGLAFFIVPYLLGGMGAGDVKLMAAAGAIFGPKGICIASVLVILSGGIYGIILFTLYPKYMASFFKKWGVTIKGLFLIRKFIPPEKDENQPILRFAFPIALGTFFFAYLKITGSNVIQNFLGVQFSI